MPWHWKSALVFLVVIGIMFGPMVYVMIWS